MNGQAGWLSADQALAHLGVRAQTLYAYVSRGRIEARPDPANPRRSLYSEPDIARLSQKRRVGRRPSAVAESAMAWGEPILPSGVSTVQGGRLIYRGQDAVSLAETASLEEVAALLWSADAGVFPAAEEPQPRYALAPDVTLFELLGRLAATSQPSQGRDAGKIHLDAATVVRAVMRAVSGVPARPREPLHAQLARGWGAVRAAEPIRRALVLLADHELNASTFAARVTASSGASLAACVLSGLCALSGPLHGCAGLAVSSMARSVGADGSLMLRRRIAEGEQIPGFGHPLYPGADPRCAALLESFATPPAHRRLRDVVARELGLEPNVDFALSAMSAAFGMDQKAPFLIFATARCVGWIAHSLEQRSEGGLIRPRARYVGALP